MNLDFMAKNEPYKENQVEWKDISYGWFYGTSLKKNGCGVIAVWNALIACGCIPGDGDVEDEFFSLKKYFEKRCIITGGLTGTPLISIYIYLLKKFGSRLYFFPKDRRLNMIGLRHRAVILMVLNDAKKPWRGMHYVCVTKDGAAFTLHNSYHKDKAGRWASDGAYKSLCEAASHIFERSIVIAAIGIG